MRVWCGHCKRDLAEGETCPCRRPRSQLERATVLAVRIAEAERKQLAAEHLARAAARVRRLA